MKYPKYPAYKASGVEWLGEIPHQWKIAKLKHLCSQSALYGANESSSSYSDNGVRFLRTTDITERGDLIDSDTAVYLDEVLVSEYLLNDGDILISRSGTVGRSFVYNSFLHGKCAYAGYLVRFVPKDNSEPRFIYYFTKSKQFEEWLSSSTISSTIGNVNGHKYANMPLPVPSSDEQIAIITFLDQETTQIDTLIAKQERLIATLQEKRQALISHAVTKGLNPDAPMKDSGVEWLGNVPAHWEVKKLKYHFEFKDSQRIPLSAEERSHKQGKYPYYGASGIIDYIDDFIFDEPLLLIGEDGANLLNRSSPLAFIATGKYWVNNHAHILKPKDSLLSFWAYRLEQVDYTPWISGSAQPKLTADSLARVHIAVPTDLNERSALTDFLDQETDKINMLVKKAGAAIERLQERRTALISATVTGKIDVRAYADG